MSSADTDSQNQLIEAAYRSAGIGAAVSMRRFPGETIFVVEVAEADLTKAIEIANSLDDKIDDGFITVKRATREVGEPPIVRPASLVDPRVDDLLELLNARSRTSQYQPSLKYVPDTRQALAIATSRRHNLIFGRRGVGKTALMLEAKRVVESKGATTLWLNLHSMRGLRAAEAFFMVGAQLCDLPSLVFSPRNRQPLSVQTAKRVRERIDAKLASRKGRRSDVGRIVPDLQELMSLFCRETDSDVYLFMDEFHYLKVDEQPVFLDLIHAVTRDTGVWLKVAGIKHQSRWFIDNPPTGLQTGHDAAIIDLDITLEQPARAKKFLSSILESYVDESKLGNVFAAISREALDRLVLASGGVPRDFMILAATAIQVAREDRPNARTAGVQDVNQAAGAIAQTKLRELADDAASARGSAKARQEALTVMNKFLLEEKQFTFMRVDFRDKEDNPSEYELLQSLMDLRMVHLINSGLSDERKAGRRAEVYMLDLSQFSGSRFRRNLRVLDFTRDFLVLKTTGAETKPRLGNTPRKLQSILRRGPEFHLSELNATVAGI